jgi:hypothetical protein
MTATFIIVFVVVGRCHGHAQAQSALTCTNEPAPMSLL